MVSGPCISLEIHWWWNILNKLDHVHPHKGKKNRFICVPLAFLKIIIGSIYRYAKRYTGQGSDLSACSKNYNSNIRLIPVCGEVSSK